ncbi:MAG: hypothetical protein RMK20_13925, partial [Verrucomicrobiales bacterium]|nr:hypothetical protein [Verrucomicrobiales bacterium]
MAQVHFSGARKRAAIWHDFQQRRYGGRDVPNSGGVHDKKASVGQFMHLPERVKLSIDRGSVAIAGTFGEGPHEAPGRIVFVETELRRRSDVNIPTRINRNRRD